MGGVTSVQELKCIELDNFAIRANLNEASIKTRGRASLWKKPRDFYCQHTEYDIPDFSTTSPSEGEDVLMYGHLCSYPRNEVQTFGFFILQFIKTITRERVFFNQGKMMR